jgi:hypothetical protein
MWLVRAKPPLSGSRQAYRRSSIILAQNENKVQKALAKWLLLRTALR